MADNDAKQDKDDYRFKDDPDDPRPENIYPSDYALEDVLNYSFGSNDIAEDGEFGLCLLVQGAIVAGTAITRYAWVAGMTANGGDQDGTVAQALRKMWTKDHEVDEEFRAKRDAAGLPQYVRRFVHMKDVSIMTAGALSPVKVPYWRTRLSEVGGWSLGTATFEEDSA